MIQDIDRLTTLLVEYEGFTVFATGDDYAVSFTEDHRLWKACTRLSRRVRGDEGAGRHLVQTKPIGIVDKRDILAFVDACVRAARD